MRRIVGGGGENSFAYKVRHEVDQTIATIRNSRDKRKLDGQTCDRHRHRRCMIHLQQVRG